MAEDTAYKLIHILLSSEWCHKMKKQERREGYHVGDKLKKKVKRDIT